MVWKKVTNSDSGDADHFGGDDFDKVSDLFSGIDVDDLDINSDITIRDQKLKYRNPANTFSLTYRNPAITSNQDYRYNSNYTYLFFLEGSTYYAKSGITKGIEFSGTDAGAVVNSALTAATNGGLFLFSPQTFLCDTKISVPIGATTGARKPYELVGTHSAQRQVGTTFQATATFTDQEFFIDASVIASSSKTALLRTKGIHFYNPFPWTGGAATSTDKRVGGILYGSDNVSTTANIRCCILEDCEFEYIWRGVDLQGAVYGAYIDNLSFLSGNTGVKGEYDFKMEKAGLADVPKSCHIGSLFSTHTAVYDNCWSIEGVYNYFENLMIDGTIFLDAPLVFRGATNNSISNIVNRLSLLDINGVPGVGSYATGPGNVADARKACILFDGTNCYDNHVLNGGVGRSPYMVTYTNSPFRNTVELGYFGGVVNINDAGAGIENVVYINEGQQPSATANTKITSTNSLVKIVDHRKGATNDGTSTQSGNATTKAFNIAHGLFTTPTYWNVIPTTSDAAGTPAITATSTNLVVTYPTAPPTGTSNLNWVWRAEVY